MKCNRKYTFIKHVDEERHDYPILAVSKKFKIRNESDTYRGGKKVKPDHVCDYLVLLTEKAVEIANHNSNLKGEDFNKKYWWTRKKRTFSIGDEFVAHPNTPLFYILNDHPLLIKGIDYEYNAVQCNCINYWNGKNYATIILADRELHGELQVGKWYRAENEDILQNEIESKRLIGTRIDGYKVYESKNYWFIRTIRYVSFARYEVYAKYYVDTMDDFDELKNVIKII